MRKNRIGPATSLSSMMCWSILPNGFKTASVCQGSVSCLGSMITPLYLCLNVSKVHPELLNYTLLA
jgi:hypothetical protein